MLTTHTSLRSGYGYGTVPGGHWAIDTEGGHVVDSVSRIRSGYEYGRRIRIPNAIASRLWKYSHGLLRPQLSFQ